MILPVEHRRATRTGYIFLLALTLAGGCATRRPIARATVAASSSGQFTRKENWYHEELAKEDPLAFLKTCHESYFENVRDYRCTFTMREMTGSGWAEQQVIAIKFRERPYSVDMAWQKNPAGARRINYVEDRWVREGRQMALVVPSGLGGIVLPMGIRLDIHGREFQKSSSRSVDQFGFGKTLERAIQLCENAGDDPQFSLTYVGRGSFDGRAQYVLERRLPYSEEEGTFPDRLAIYYIDAEWLTPTAVWTFADEQKKQPLGEFITTHVEFNPGLTDADFD